MVRFTAVAIAAAFFLTFGAFFMIQERFLFFPESLPQDFDYSLPENAEEVFFDTEDGERINALWYRAENTDEANAAEDESRGVILYFHGNAGSLRTWKSVAPQILSTGHDLFIIDYRGFGKSTGTLSEKGLYADGRGAYRELLARGYEPDDIVVLGRSIGTGIACEIAATEEIGALILETPFTSMVELASEYIPILPRLILNYKFENEKKAAQIDVPTLIIHGDQDEVIPIEHGRAVFEAFSEPREFVVLTGASHNDFTGHPEYVPALSAFLDGAR